MTEQVVLLQEAVQKPFEAKQPSGLKRLMDLLSRTMIRAAKKDLVTIPPLYYKVKILSLLVRKYSPHFVHQYSWVSLWPYQVRSVILIFAVSQMRLTSVLCNLLVNSMLAE